MPARRPAKGALEVDPPSGAWQEPVARVQSLVGPRFGMTGEIVSTASFTVRDDRDLTQIYQRDPAAPDAVASCTTYNDPTAET